MQSIKQSARSSGLFRVTKSRSINFVHKIYFLKGFYLQKAVNWWQDLGYGTYELYYLRTKDKREVDFLVVRNNKPWFIAEVKSSSHKRLSKNLEYFQTRTGAPHAFEVIRKSLPTGSECFYDNPYNCVPA